MILPYGVPMAIIDPFGRGQKARKDGLPLSANPQRVEPFRKEWARGWRSVKGADAKHRKRPPDVESKSQEKPTVTEADTERLLQTVRDFAERCDRARRPQEINYFLDECELIKIRRGEAARKFGREIEREVKRFGKPKAEPKATKP